MSDHLRENGVCPHHSGVMSEINNCEKERGVLFKKIEDVEHRSNSTRNWIMAIAGGMIVSLILLIINIVINLNGR